MTKSLLAIALAAATMPLTFAQTTPAPAQNPPAQTDSSKKAPKKNTKHNKKAPKKTDSNTSATPSK